MAASTRLRVGRRLANCRRSHRGNQRAPNALVTCAPPTRASSAKSDTTRRGQQAAKMHCKFFRLRRDELLTSVAIGQLEGRSGVRGLARRAVAAGRKGERRVVATAGREDRAGVPQARGSARGQGLRQALNRRVRRASRPSAFLVKCSRHHPLAPSVLKVSRLSCVAGNALVRLRQTDRAAAQPSPDARRRASPRSRDRRAGRALPTSDRPARESSAYPMNCSSRPKSRSRHRACIVVAAPLNV